jgi:hypothetical protein
MWDTAEIEIFPVVVLFLVLASCHVLCARQGRAHNEMKGLCGVCFNYVFLFINHSHPWP